MEEKKTCIKCGIEKILNNDNFVWDKTREKWKGNCRNCVNQQRNERRAKSKGIEYPRRKIETREENRTGQTKPKYDIGERNKTMQNMFTENEIEILKNIASKNNEIMAILNNKIELSNDSNKKVKRSISVNEIIDKKLLELQKKSNLTYSDIVNNLIKKALELI